MYVLDVGLSPHLKMLHFEIERISLYNRSFNY